MILNTNLITLFHLFVCIHIIDYVKGYKCFDDSESDDCKCSTGTQTGKIGTCTCSPTTVVRHGQQCSFDSANQVDSVSVSYSIYC